MHAAEAGAACAGHVARPDAEQARGDQGIRMRVRVPR